MIPTVGTSVKYKTESGETVVAEVTRVAQDSVKAAYGVDYFLVDLIDGNARKYEDVRPAEDPENAQPNTWWFA